MGDMGSGANSGSDGRTGCDELGAARLFDWSGSQTSLSRYVDKGDGERRYATGDETTFVTEPKRIKPVRGRESSCELVNAVFSMSSLATFFSFPTRAVAPPVCTRAFLAGLRGETFPSTSARRSTHMSSVRLRFTGQRTPGDGGSSGQNIDLTQSSSALPGRSRPTAARAICMSSESVVPSLHERSEGRNILAIRGKRSSYTYE